MVCLEPLFSFAEFTLRNEGLSVNFVNLSAMGRMTETDDRRLTTRINLLFSFTRAKICAVDGPLAQFGRATDS